MWLEILNYSIEFKYAAIEMSTLGPKQALFAQFATIAKTLGHGHRLELLEQLAQGERTVEVLAQRTGLSVANASQHLQHLRRAGLLKSRRQANSFVTRWPTMASSTFSPRYGGSRNAMSPKSSALFVATSTSSTN